MDEANLFNTYCNIKKSPYKFWTNIYSFNPIDHLEKLRSQENCKIYCNKNSLLLVEQETLLNRVHFFMEASKYSANLFDDVEIMPLALELIEDGRNFQLIELLPSFGFNLYSSLSRMTQKNRGEIKLKSQEKIEYANLDDAEFISGLYWKYFDVLIDRIPDEKKIKEKLSKGLVLCVKDCGVILAFALISITPGIATLEHIFVRPEFQGKGLGQSLFENFLLLSANSKGVKLWVLPGNKRAIAMYNKYNFEFDGLTNLIYKKYER